RKDAGIDQFVFGFTSSAETVLCHQFSVGEGALRIFVQRLHIGMCRRTVKKVIVLLHILTVVALGAGQTEEAFFKDGICSIPQAQREAQATLFVADAQQAIFAPAVSTGARMVMWKEIPGTTRRRIVLTN